MATSKKTDEQAAATVTHKNLAQAVIAVMKEVKGMEKNSRVGTGGAAYDGTKDMDVKDIFNRVLAENGLVILPIDIQEETQVDRWEEVDQWSKSTPKAMKMKQAVFTKVNTRYKLIHADSGESEILAGYGHGVDPQDKGAGKATTYALKNTLLYTFLTPVGKIDDADNTHSQDHPTPQNKPQQPTQKKPTGNSAPSNKAQEAITKITNAINGAKSKKELNEVWGKVPEKLQAVEALKTAASKKQAELKAAAAKYDSNSEPKK